MFYYFYFITAYWHQVRSYGSKNIAVSVLFSRLKEFNSTGCEKTKYDAFPLDNANMVWTYPGHGPQTLGNSDPFELRQVFDNAFINTSANVLSLVTVFILLNSGTCLLTLLMKWRKEMNYLTVLLFLVC